MAFSVVRHLKVDDSADFGCTGGMILDNALARSMQFGYIKRFPSFFDNFQRSGNQ